MTSGYDEGYRRIARERLKAALPHGFNLAEFHAREIGGGARTVATIEWAGNRVMTIDFGVTEGGVEAAITGLVEAFQRLFTRPW